MAILQLQKSYLYLEQKAFPHLAIGLKEAFNTMLLLMGREAQIQSIKIWDKTQFLFTELFKNGRILDLTHDWSFEDTYYEKKWLTPANIGLVSIQLCVQAFLSGVRVFLTEYIRA